MVSPHDSRLKHAMDYASRGWAVLPLHSIANGKCSCGKSGCASAGKHPRTPRGVYDASTDPQKIKDWYTKYPDANIGIATGAKSGLEVLDVDPRYGGSNSIIELVKKHGEFRDTYTVRTGGNGQHYYYTHPGGTVTNGTPYPGIDIKGDGGYVVAPPSNHSSGGVYINLGAPTLSPLPHFVRIQQDSTQIRPSHGTSVAAALKGKKKIPGPIQALINEGVPKGSRSEALCKVYQALYKSGHTEDETVKILLDPGNGLSDKPIKQGEKWLRGDIRRVLSKVLVKPTMTNMKTRLVRMSDVEPEEIDWLCPPYIPIGKLTIIEGDPGIGKSYLTLAIAAAVSKGEALYGSKAAEPGNVLLYTAEDGIADTVRPRLDAVSAEVHRICSIVGRLIASEDDGFDELEQHIADTQPILVIIDPLVGFMGGKINMNQANEVREITSRLAEIAEEHSCAVVVVRHKAKQKQSNALYNGLGSIDLAAAARSIMSVAVDPDDKSLRHIVHIKSNLAACGQSLAYKFDNGKFEWAGASDYTPRDLCRGSHVEDERPIEMATDFLQRLLSDGPRKAVEAIKAAEAEGIASSTLNRAKKILGVASKQITRGDGRHWVWTLPDSQSNNIKECENVAM
jgi:archaellum biogenesis ATPase FlaH